jgi:hypothetical protein
LGTCLILLGGLLYHPNNFDYLAYRFPRLLNWWWSGHWSWLDTGDDRENISAVGMEWLMTPLFVLFRTDRLFFLINLISFLLLPGLIFSILRRSGVSGRMAWNWMWLLPFGYCFLFQAGSMANDAFAAVPFLAAIYYVQRARADSPIFAAWSVISIALVTGDKASNMPLVLPWVAAIWIKGGPFFSSLRHAIFVVGFFVALSCSFLPMALINILHTGSYTGELHDSSKLRARSPLFGLMGNGIEVATANLAPPVWPHPLDLNFLPPGLTKEMKRNYPRYEVGIPAFQTESTAGVGPLVTLLLALSIGAGLSARFKKATASRVQGAVLMTWSTIVAWIGYMSQMGSEAAPRLMVVYYIAGILALLPLFPESGAFLRGRWWRGAAVASMVLGLALLAINPPRPLVSMNLMASLLKALPLSNEAQAKVLANFELQQSRRDIFRPLRTLIPDSEKNVLVIRSLVNPEVSLWLPFGSRSISAGHPEFVGSLRNHYVVVGGAYLKEQYGLSISSLLLGNSLRVIQQQDVLFRENISPETWYLLGPVESASSQTSQNSPIR